MRILLVVATYPEIEPFIRQQKQGYNVHDFLKIGPHELKLIITGVGMVATAFALGIELSKQSYDLAINAGVAGSFYRNIKIGQLVEVRADMLAELGAQDDEEFISLDELELGEVEFNASSDSALAKDLRKVNAITVNTVHGNEESIDEIRGRLNPTIESMEGAAFFYACEEASIPALQIRAISNYVEKRKRENWNIPIAVKNLNDWLTENIKKL